MALIYSIVDPLALPPLAAISLTSSLGLFAKFPGFPPPAVWVVDFVVSSDSPDRAIPLARPPLDAISRTSSFGLLAKLPEFSLWAEAWPPLEAISRCGGLDGYVCLCGRLSGDEPACRDPWRRNRCCERPSRPWRRW